MLVGCGCHRHDLRTWGLVLAATLLAAGCSSFSSTGGSSDAGRQSSATANPESGVVRVVAAENFWGNITSQIGGSRVAVTSIISNPNTDPHVYQSDPRDAAELDGAQLVIENGLGYDSFIDKILATASRPSRHVLDVAATLGVGGANPNPHLWYDTARLPAVAVAIAAQLSAIDPSDAATFTRNAVDFDTSLRPILAVIAQIKAKYAGTPIAYTERVPGYLVQAAGLVLGTPASFSQAIEDGNDPSPQDNAAFDADIKQHRVKVLLYNSQVVDAQTTAIKSLANSSGVPIVGVFETLPPTDPTFQAWQLRQARDLLTALGGS